MIKEDQRWLGWLDRRWQIMLTLGIVAIAPLARIVRAQTLACASASSCSPRAASAPGPAACSPRDPAQPRPGDARPSPSPVSASSSPPRAALAFLGLGVETPTPTWGKLIDVNRDRIDEGWWATIFPCLLLFLTVLSFNLIGDRLARRFDIREATI